MQGYISTKQAAKLTGYTKDYVGQLARQGHIDSIKQGRARLVKTIDLFKYVQNKEDQKTTESPKKSQEMIESQVNDPKPVEPLVSAKSEINTKKEAIHHSSLEDIASNSRLNELSSPELSPVTKKVISPWLHNLSDDAVEPKVVNASGFVVRQTSAQTLSRPDSFSDIAVDNKDISEEKSTNNFLPLISRFAMAVSVVVFMATLGMVMFDVADNDQFKTNSVAAIGDLGLIDSVAFGWYKLVSEVLD